MSENVSILPSAALVNNPRTWEKFDSVGEVKRHPGSTFVCHLVTDSPVYRVAKQIREDVVQSGLGQNFALVPPASYHMTVLEGLKNKLFIGQEEKWPAWLAGTADFPEAVAAMRAELVTADVEGLRDVAMEPVGVYPLAEMLTIALQPKDDHVAAELDRFRKDVGGALGIEVADLHDYRFHVTVGYRLTEVEKENTEPENRLEEKYADWATAAGRVDLEPVAFTVFNDMSSYSPLLYFR